MGQEWENFCNFNRPYGGLDGQNPYERHEQKTENPGVIDRRQLHVKWVCGWCVCSRMMGFFLGPCPKCQTI